MIQDMDYQDKIDFYQAKCEQSLRSSLKFQQLTNECSVKLSKSEADNRKLREENQRLREMVNHYENYYFEAKDDAN